MRINIKKSCRNVLSQNASTKVTRFKHETYMALIWEAETDDKEPKDHKLRANEKQRNLTAL